MDRAHRRFAVQESWYFDRANSLYPTVIVTSFFGNQFDRAVLSAGARRLCRAAVAPLHRARAVPFRLAVR